MSGGVTRRARAWIAGTGTGVVETGVASAGLAVVGVAPARISDRPLDGCPIDPADTGAFSLARSRRRLGLCGLVLGASVLLSACAVTPTAEPSGTSAATGGRDVFGLSAEADRAYRDGRWIEAARRYTELTERVPADAYAWFRLGNTHAQQGDYPRAIRAYETSLERDATQAKPWFNLSTAYLLHAQVAMLRARERLRPGDPARVMIDARLEGLGGLLHGRIEDVSLSTSVR